MNEAASIFVLLQVCLEGAHDKQNEYDMHIIAIFNIFMEGRNYKSLVDLCPS